VDISTVLVSIEGIYRTPPEMNHNVIKSSKTIKYYYSKEDPETTMSSKGYIKTRMTHDQLSTVARMTHDFWDLQYMCRTRFFFAYLGQRKHHGEARVSNVDTRQDEDEYVELMEGVN